MPFPDLDQELQDLAAQDLLRQRRILDSAQGAHVKVDGQEYLSFCSNDYLGLAAHPRLIDAACRSAQQNGVGAGAAH